MTNPDLHSGISPFVPDNDDRPQCLENTYTFFSSPLHPTPPSRASHSLEMEAIRKRFLQPITRPTPAPELAKATDVATPQNTTTPGQPLATTPLLKIALSDTQSVRFGGETVTLHDTQHGESIISLSSPAQLKVTTLQHLRDHLQSVSPEGTQVIDIDLGSTAFASLVRTLIQMFHSKLDCLTAIAQFTLDPETADILHSWAEKEWTKSKNGGDDRSDDDQSRDGSLFCDSDVEEIPATTRVRPITLRPRRPPSVFIKEEKVVKAEKGTTPSTPTTTINDAVPHNPTRHLRKASPVRTGNTLKDGGRSPGRSVARTLSSPNLRHKPTKLSLRRDFAPSNGGTTKTSPSDTISTSSHEGSKKRALPVSRGRENTPSGRHLKRIKSADMITRTHQSSQQTSSAPGPPGSELSGLMRVLENPDREYVEKFWRDTVASFPEHVQQSSNMEDKVEWFFGDVEFLRKENERMRRDEADRRKATGLLGEKIMLLNRPIKRGFATD